MTAILAFAAFAIDVSQWYTARHQAQVTADAAALAAANCLAFPNSGPSPQCASPGIDTTDATTIATDYSQNGVTVSAGNVTIDTSKFTVTVTADITAGSGFASLFGIGRRNISATAVASFTTQPTSCSSPGSGCDFMFAGNSDCSTLSNGIALNLGGNTSISGNIATNGNLSGSTGNVTLGTATYGPGTGCQDAVTANGSHQPWTTTPGQELADAAYPLDYTKDFPECYPVGSQPVAGELECQSSGYPTFCTQWAQNYSSLNPTSGNIYCASGTGTGVETYNPATWTGAITINNAGGFDTFVAGTVTYSPNGTNQLSACGWAVAPTGYTAANCNASVPAPATTNYPIIYATSTGTTTPAVNLSVSGNDTLNGDIFAPNGTASLSMTGSKTLTMFIEALNISATVRGNFTGDGPQAGPSGPGGPQGDLLVQ